MVGSALERSTRHERSMPLAGSHPPQPPFFAYRSSPSRCSGSETSDEMLVRRARSGDRAAAGALVRRYEDRIFALALAKLRSREDAEDVTQEVFVKAFAALERFRGGCAFYTWLYQIALNRCMDVQRRRQRKPSPLSLADPFLQEPGREPVDASCDRDPYSGAVREEVCGAVQAAIDSLPERLRLAVILHDLEGMTEREVGALLGCPAGTIKSRLHRARGLLRNELAGWAAG